MSLPHFERSKPFGSERRLASFSRLVGAWVAISPTASSFSTRLARHVAALRLLLAPGRDLDQHRELPRLAHPRLQPFPGALGVEIVGPGRGQNLHLLADPVVAAALLQVGVERCEHVAQMGDVGDRVMQLLVGERPARPVGEAVGLVGPVAGDALDQLVIGDAVAIAEHHRGHLGVEDRMRNGAGLVHRRSRCPAARHGTPSTPSRSPISSKNGFRSMPGASVSITTASSGLAICTTQSRG